MIAAIYARKSTEQRDVDEDQKSVARQIDHARSYAERRGWAVSPDLVFIDDGISGAEFAKRPGFVRLMNALKPRPPFQILVMSEESRLGRESIETAYALKQLIQSGVRVFFYLEDRERTLETPTEKVMLSLTAFADELEREKARLRTYDALRRKAAPATSPAAASSATTTSNASAATANGRTSSGASTRRGLGRPRDLSTVRDGVWVSADRAD
jgi:DNA invertase Pin-like site-specific DNA recombinase